MRRQSTKKENPQEHLLLRFEPGQTEPKPVVLPLHHSPNFRCFLLKSGAKIWVLQICSKLFICFFSPFPYFPYFCPL